MATAAYTMTVCMLCGGVGGARAALALAENLPAESLTFVVNTGDDFTHLGLEIWPDWDTVIYTLAGMADTARGWGRHDEGVRAMEEFSRLEAPDWFHLGDRDLALHVYRSWELSQRPAHLVAEQIARRFEVAPRVLRVTDRSLETQFQLKDGSNMDFQSWFVRHQGRPEVAEVTSSLCERLTPGVAEAIADSELLLLAPSNPYLSLFPMLALPEVRQAIACRRGPAWAVSPLVGGKAVKGPLDALLSQLSPETGQQAIVELYRNWVERLLLPGEELSGLEPRGVGLVACRTLLGTLQQRRAFVEDLLSVWKPRV